MSTEDETNPTNCVQCGRPSKKYYRIRQEDRVWRVSLARSSAAQYPMLSTSSTQIRLFYLLRNLLRKQGLSGKAREIIIQALIVSHLSYALPAFAGLHVARFNAFFANLLDEVLLTEYLILKLSYVMLRSYCLSTSRTKQNIV
jgi:hypothetical protein